MTALSSGGQLGNTGISSLIKSAASLQNQLATHEDTIQKSNFDNNPTSANLQTYLKYLSGRVTVLNSSGTIADATKAVTMSNAMKTAVTTSTTFNIDLITGQMLKGGATDQNKLDYLTQNVLNNPLVQQSPSMYAKYMDKAYNLQKSIEYQAQVTQTAQETQTATDLAAQERGYANGEAALDASWKQLNDAQATGNESAVKSAFSELSKTMAPIYKAAGIKIPTGATGDIVTANVGYLMGKALYAENSAQAVGPDNPDYQKYMDEANGIVQSSDFKTVVSNAMAPSNLYSTSTNAEGNTSLVRNTTTGYNTVSVTLPGLAPMTVQVPQTSGNTQTNEARIGKGNQSALDNQLKGLGLNILPSQGGNIRVAVSDKSPDWIKNQPDLSPGTELTIIPTAKGAEFISANNTHYGLSFDQRGLGALYTQTPASVRGGTTTPSTWKQVSGAYGYSAQNNAAPAAKSATQNITSVFKGIIGLGSSSPAPSGPTMVQRAGGGFNFTNAAGKAVSAAAYAQQTNTPFRTLLTKMADAGDTASKTVLGFVGNDFGYDPTKIGNNAGLYNADVYGVHTLAPQGAAPTSLSIKGY